jgi:hypothetical protein
VKWPQGSHGWGIFLLGIWLIVSGASGFIHVGSLNVGPLLPVLAIVAGVLILLGR